MRKMDPAYLSSEPDTNVSETLGKTKLAWTPPLVGDWMRMVRAKGQPTYLLNDMMPSDANILVTGKAKRAKKSFLAGTWCAALASGKPVGPFVPTNPNGIPVAYLSAEEPEPSTLWRFVAMANGYGIDIENCPNYYFSHRENLVLTDPSNVKRIKAFIAEKGIQFLVIDPLIMFTSSDENDAVEMAKVMRILNEFRAMGCTNVFVHHLRKSAKDWNPDPDEDVRGSSAIIGFYDQHWAIRQHDKDQEWNDLTIRSKSAEDREFQLTWNFDNDTCAVTFDLTGQTTDVKLENVKDKVLGEMMSGMEYSKSRIQDLAKLSKTSFEKVFKALLDSQRIVPFGKGYTKAKLKVIEGGK